MIAFGFLAAVVVLGLYAWVFGTTAQEQHLLRAFETPSREFPLGTDQFGRDVLVRTIAGASTALIGPILVSLGTLAIAVPCGLIAGYRGGWVDALVMRTVDFMVALPALLVATVLVGILGGGYWLAVMFLILISAPEDIRTMRGATLNERTLPYVQAAHTLGLSRGRIIFRHIFPNVLPILVASFFLRFAFALISLAALSYLGLGVGPGDADWGRMLSDSRTHIPDTPLAALVPGAMIILTAVSMNLIGDWSYDQFTSRVMNQ